MTLPEFWIAHFNQEKQNQEYLTLRYPNRVDVFEGSTYLNGAAVNYELLMNTTGVNEAISQIYSRELKIDEGLPYLKSLIDSAQALLMTNTLVVPPEIPFSEAMKEIGNLYVGVPEDYLLYKPVYERRVKSPISDCVHTSFREDLIVTDFSKGTTLFMSKFRELPYPNWYSKYLQPEEIVKKAQEGALEEDKGLYEISKNRYYFQLKRQGIRAPLSIIHGHVFINGEQYYHILEVKKEDDKFTRLYHFMEPVELES